MIEQNQDRTGLERRQGREGEQQGSPPQGRRRRRIGPFRFREFFGSADQTRLGFQVARAKRNSRKEILIVGFILIVFILLLSFNWQQYDKTKAENSSQMLWMDVNVLFMTFALIFSVWKSKCITPTSFCFAQSINIFLQIFGILIGIWGCVIMFGHEYNKNGTWGTDFSNETGVYRKIFEVMVFLRLISLVCRACTLFAFVCVLVPLRNAANIPLFGKLTHAFIDSKTRAYDVSKDGSDATCIICYTDFAEQPDKAIAELNCSNKHIFHVECLKQWINTARNRKCPLCKEIIPDKIVAAATQNNNGSN